MQPPFRTIHDLLDSENCIVDYTPGTGAPPSPPRGARREPDARKLYPRHWGSLLLQRINFISSQKGMAPLAGKTRENQSDGESAFWQVSHHSSMIDLIWNPHQDCMIFGCLLGTLITVSPMVILIDDPPSRPRPSVRAAALCVLTGWLRQGSPMGPRPLSSPVGSSRGTCTLGSTRRAEQAVGWISGAHSSCMPSTCGRSVWGRGSLPRTRVDRGGRNQGYFQHGMGASRRSAGFYR